MKKHLHVLTVLILSGLAFTACGGDDSDSGTPVKPVVPSSDAAWTVTVRSAVTRGLNATATSLTPVWKTTESVYVYYGNSEEYIGTLNPQSDANATVATPLVGRLNALSGTTFVAGGKITLYYLQDQGYSADYSTQDGEIETIAENFNCATAVTTIDEVDYSTHTLVINSAAFTSVEQPAVVRFEFNQALNSGDVITIKNGEETLTTVTLEAAKAASNPVYVALQAGTYTPSFTITRSGSTVYTGSLTAKTLAAKTYYKTTVTLSAPYRLGDVLDSGRTVVVVYVGPDTGVDGYTNGLAMCKEYPGSDDFTWGNWPNVYRDGNVPNSSTLKVTNSGWFVPSEAQVKKMSLGYCFTDSKLYWSSTTNTLYDKNSKTYVADGGSQQRVRWVVAF